ncbi:MAG: hypothetical protein K1X64_09460 [Myxococcaceae bacterium]|nr:hypothetical protein [Myxococcaceae bacterium]
MTKRWGALTAALTLMVWAVACDKCAPTSKVTGKGIAQRLPKTVRAAVMVSDLTALGEGVKVLEGLKAAGFVAQLRGFNDGKAWGDALVAELGVDIRDPKAVEEAGIDAQRGVAAAVLADQSPVAVLAVKDEQKLYAFVRKVAITRLRTEKHEEKKLEGNTLHTFGFHGGPAQLQLLFHDGYAYVAADAESTRVLALSKLTKEEALDGDASYTASMKRLPQGQQVVVYVPQPALWRQMTPFSHAAVGLSLTGKGLALASDATWLGDASLLGVLTRKASPKATASIPRDAFFVASLAGDVNGLSSVSEVLFGPRFMAALAQGGLDFKKEILGNAAPGFWLAFSLAPKPKLADGMPSLDVRQTNPFNYVHLSGAAQANDAAALQATLEKVASMGPQLGAQIVKRERAGKPFYFTTYGQGEGVHFAAREQQFYFGSPVARLEALLDGSKPAGESLDAATQKLFEERGVAMVLDIKKLTTRIRELPDDAWGIGGFRIRQATERWLNAISDLGALQLTFDGKDGAVQSQMRLTFVPAETPK